MGSMHWVVVADASKARIFASDDLLDQLDLIDEMKPGARSEYSDHAGRTQAGPGGARSGMEAHDPHALDDERFARAVAGEIAAGRNEHEFERVVLVAPPTFLGRIRHALDEGSSRTVVASIAHDWTKIDDVRDLSRRIKAALPETAGM